nr:glycosyltransferase [uncultured Pseudomonas sp.]
MKEFNIDEFRNAVLPLEVEIMATWNSQTPLVSIVCTTYNHKHYIEDAIRGFLIQRTDFPFEIIIHDDASTDGTNLIVQKYVEGYPTLIKYIQQAENQYSKGKRIIPLASKQAVGEYLALCEGDDFWISPEKLSIQISSMQNYGQCKISFHRAFVWGGGLSARLFRRSSGSGLNYPNRPYVFPVKSVILGDGGFMPTPSIVVRKECLDNLPAWFDETPVGDYFIQILSSVPGGALYLPDEMCLYRAHSSGSWSSAMKVDPERRLKFFDSYISAMQKLGVTIGDLYAGPIGKMIFVRFCHLLLERHITLGEVSSRSKLVANCAGKERKKLKLLLSFDSTTRLSALIGIMAFRSMRTLSSILAFLPGSWRSRFRNV